MTFFLKSFPYTCEQEILYYQISIYMQFYDEVKISVQSGKWGDGCATGRREAGVPYGGPSGGNGGDGGSVVFIASKDENTLVPFKFRKIFKAHYGEPGRGKDQYGANAPDLELKVPIGTMVKDINGHILHVFSKDTENRTVVKWGKWGVGNIHFKDAINQYPNFFLMGEPGQQKEITLELQLLADVALIGTPSVGKSSLINAVSHTKAKVAEYHFTTLIPNLGSVHFKETTFNMIDIPGLIKGAAEGKGLGNAFLRHVLKAKIFCVVCDGSRYDAGIQEVVDLFQEIMEYIDQKFDNPDIDIIKKDDMITLIASKNGELILEKRIIFLINKYDLINDPEILGEERRIMEQQLQIFFKQRSIWAEITKELLNKYILEVSAATRYGIDERLTHLIPMLKNTKDEEVYHIPEFVAEEQQKEDMMIRNISAEEKQKLIDESYIQELDSKYNEIREIRDPDLCRLVRILPRWNGEAEQRFWNGLQHKWVLELFEQHNIQKWDVLKIKSYYAGCDDRYIMY